MKLTNVAIFIPHLACRNRCAFCNQNIITGKLPPTGSEKIKEIINSQIPFLTQNNYIAEIAFFGGTFTALETDYMTEILRTAYEYLEKYPAIFKGIRCSTRPDYINEKIIELLKSYNVTAIELGAQSLDNSVLIANKRGHTADDTFKAARIIKNSGLELGLQMMTGLFKDTIQKSHQTADQFIKIKPDTVRIYPTVIMPNTELAKLYLNGEYKTFSFEETISLCADLYHKFTQNNIRVIRIGLDTSDYIERTMIGGNYHPSMGELCVGRYFYNEILKAMQNIGDSNFVIESDKMYFGKIVGQSSENRKKLLKKGFNFKLKEKKGTAPIIRSSCPEKVKVCFLKP